MPTLGDIKKDYEIGRGHKSNNYTWSACSNCGKERWVQLKAGKPRNLKCVSCVLRQRHITEATKLKMSKAQQGEHHPRWNGGEYKADGYVFILKPDHPRAHYGHVKRAIIVLEEKLGRPLLPGMDSHHKNEIKDDDRPENLEEILHDNHATLHLRERNSNRIYEEPILTVNAR